jgi:uncharacterized protein YjdB
MKRQDPTRRVLRVSFRAAVALLAACSGTTELDLSNLCFLGPCVDFPRQPYVTVMTANGRVNWDTLRAGQSLALTATARDTLGNAIPVQSYVWRSYTPLLATVSPAGVVTAIGLGAASIGVMALPDSIYGGIYLAIVPGALASITVSPPTATIRQGESRTFVVRGFDAFGNATSDSIANWSSSDTSVGTVSSSGVVLAVAASGSAQITAVMGGKSISATILAAAPGDLSFVRMALGAEHGCA